MRTFDELMTRIEHDLTAPHHTATPHPLTRAATNSRRWLRHRAAAARDLRTLLALRRAHLTASNEYHSHSGTDRERARARMLLYITEARAIAAELSADPRSHTR
ncbi:hypothetical protein FPZ12_024135 [Amycolatopsis acidicola]|uniref:Uncharacterized protein n=1 Tax=Amycolatopsis acidicola TaxID=2596893 RepID=A0A5N0UYM9_9PSEU|nr:hypothetical protein [Amycolatopsis acidicola]KAA9157974.1 hypothetical protein FPZ12_024135 [Amycolatopsis acidicola]